MFETSAANTAGMAWDPVADRPLVPHPAWQTASSNGFPFHKVFSPYPHDQTPVQEHNNVSAGPLPGMTEHVGAEGNNAVDTTYAAITSEPICSTPVHDTGLATPSLEGSQSTTPDAPSSPHDLSRPFFLPSDLPGKIFTPELPSQQQQMNETWPSVFREPEAKPFEVDSRSFNRFNRFGTNSMRFFKYDSVKEEPPSVLQPLPSDDAFQRYGAVEQHGLLTPPVTADFYPDGAERSFKSQQRERHTFSGGGGFAYPQPTSWFFSSYNTHSVGLRRVTPQRQQIPCQIGGCNKTFVSSWNLSEHLKTHNKDRPKPHLCEFEGCGKSYYHLRDLRRHCRKIHFKPNNILALRKAALARHGYSVKAELLAPWVHSQQNMFEQHPCSLNRPFYETVDATQFRALY